MLRFTLAVLLAATASAATPDNVSSRLMIHVSTRRKKERAASKAV
jgi:hypothetical protein